MATNKTFIKSEIMASFKTKLTEILTNNNNTFSIKISSELDNKSMQFQKYLMTTVKEIVSEMSKIHTSTSLPPVVKPSSMISSSFNPPIHTFLSSQHPGYYPWPKDTIPSHFSPSQFMSQPPSIANTPPVNITPTQANHKIHHEVKMFVRQSILLADAEAALTSAMATKITTITTL